jgi:hypothetical protein
MLGLCGKDVAVARAISRCLIQTGHYRRSLGRTAARGEETVADFALCLSPLAAGDALKSEHFLIGRPLDIPLVIETDIFEDCGLLPVDSESSQQEVAHVSQTDQSLPLPGRGDRLAAAPIRRCVDAGADSSRQQSPG